MDRTVAGRGGRLATSRAIERLGLGPYADRRAGVLSSGNLKRLGLAQAGFEAIAEDGALLLSQAEAIAAPDRVATILVNAGAASTRLAIQQEDLEAHFLRLTGGTA